MRLSKRFETIEPYLFVGISRTIAEKKQQGIDVISFGIGDPDIPTPDFVLDSLKKHSSNPSNHQYPESEGLPEFREAVTSYYRDRFGVKLDYESEVDTTHQLSNIPTITPTHRFACLFCRIIGP